MCRTQVSVKSSMSHFGHVFPCLLHTSCSTTYGISECLGTTVNQIHVQCTGFSHGGSRWSQPHIELRFVPASSILLGGDPFYMAPVLLCRFFRLYLRSCLKLQYWEILVILKTAFKWQIISLHCFQCLSRTLQSFFQFTKVGIWLLHWNHEIWKCVVLEIKSPYLPRMNLATVTFWLASWFWTRFAHWLEWWNCFQIYIGKSFKIILS